MPCSCLNGCNLFPFTLLPTAPSPAPFLTTDIHCVCSFPGLLKNPLTITLVSYRGYSFGQPPIQALPLLHPSPPSGLCWFLKLASLSCLPLPYPCNTYIPPTSSPPPTNLPLTSVDPWFCLIPGLRWNLVELHFSHNNESCSCCGTPRGELVIWSTGKKSITPLHPLSLTSIVWLWSPGQTAEACFLWHFPKPRRIYYRTLIYRNIQTYV